MTFKAILITIFVITAVVLAGGAAFLWYQARTVRGFGMEIMVSEEALVGVPFSAEVSVRNDSASVLEDTELAVELPEGIVFLGSEPEKHLEVRRIGNVGVGSLTRERFELLALEGERTVREIQASVSYLPGTLGSRFEKKERAQFSITGASIDIDIAMPQKIFSGESFDAAVKYRNMSGFDFSGARLRLVYPPSFAFGSAVPKPDFSNNVWSIGALKGKSEGDIAVTGALIGPDDSFFEFRTAFEAEFLGRTYTIAEKQASISIAPSPLSIAASLNNNPNFIAHPGDDLNYALSFTNSTDIGLKDVIVKAQLIGEMFDLSTLQSNAFLRSSDNTLIWNAANTAGLSILSPGAAGTVNFSIRAKQAYPIARLSDKNFTLKVNALIESPTVPHFVASQKTLGIATLETKVGGRIQADAKGLFRDAPSGILNKGPLPLKVGVPTNFTIHWVITNFSTDVENIEVKAFLGGNVRFTGVVKSNASTEPIYNDRTQEMVWTIPSMPATKGVIGSPFEAVFQVEATPSVNQVGSGVVLLQETTARADDLFTGETLTGVDAAVTTASLDDPTVSPQDGIVLQ